MQLLHAATAPPTVPRRAFRAPGAPRPRPGRTATTVAALGLLLGLPSPAAPQEARVMSGPEMAEILAAHNEARRRFRVPVLAWGTELAEQALRCVEENRGRSFRHCDSGFGENMYASTNPRPPAEAVRAWMDEEVDYDDRRDRCRDFACGHFTQVVWSATRRVGCARGPGERGWINVICNYDPPGNYGFMGDERGERDPNGRWFYFDPAPFTLAPAPPTRDEPVAPTAPPGGADRPGAREPSGGGAPQGGAASILWDAPWAPEGGAQRSARIGHGGQSSLRGRLEGPGTLTFEWRVSSEPEFDRLAFLVDGREVIEAISGETRWGGVTVRIPAGVHEVAWVYEKDEDTSSGADAAWVRGIGFGR